jgi:hypothetical protein
MPGKTRVDFLKINLFNWALIEILKIYLKNQATPIGCHAPEAPSRHCGDLL